MSVAYRLTTSSKRARINPEPFFYQQGTWTPDFTDGTTSAGGNWAGEYVKIGSLVKLFGSATGVSYSGMSSGAIARMSGFPFAVKSGTVTHWVSGTMYIDDVEFGPRADGTGAMGASQYTAAFVSFRISAGNTYATFIEMESNTGGTNLIVGAFAASNNFQFTLEYLTDE